MLSHWKLDAAGSPHYTCRTLTSLYSQEMIQGRADTFCLHLNRKWMGKDILMKQKKKLHQLFSELHNDFSTKSPRTSVHFCQRCTSFLNPSLKKLVLCFWNYFLTADVTSSSQLKCWTFKCSFSLGTGGNHLEPDLGCMVDAAALKTPGAELHLLLLHLCEALRCRVEEVFHFLFQYVRFFFLMQ